MKSYIFAALFLILVVSMVVPSYADSKTSVDLTKNIKPSVNLYNHDHLTNVHFPNSLQLAKANTVAKQQDLNKAQGNYVVGQLWGSSTVVAKQATQAQQAQNSHQATNAHQATQAHQAQEGSSTPKSSTILPLPKTNNPFLKLP